MYNVHTSRLERRRNWCFGALRTPARFLPSPSTRLCGRATACSGASIKEPAELDRLVSSASHSFRQQSRLLPSAVLRLYKAQTSIPHNKYLKRKRQGSHHCISIRANIISGFYPLHCTLIDGDLKYFSSSAIFRLYASPFQLPCSEYPTTHPFSKGKRCLIILLYFFIIYLFSLVSLLCFVYIFCTRDCAIILVYLEMNEVTT